MVRPRVAMAVPASADPALADPTFVGQVPADPLPGAINRT